MQGYIPFEIQVNIMEKLPVKSLIQFRSVSKAWKSLIDSTKFIAGYGVRHNQPQLLLIRYESRVTSEYNYVCFVDDDTFPKQKFDLTVPSCVELLNDSILEVSCQGLLFLYGSYKKKDDSVNDVVVIWNPSIRKSVAVALPKFDLETPSSTALGFGVCPNTGDPKIVYMCKWYELGSLTCSSWQVKVFTLSSGSWRNRSSNQPRKSIDFTFSEIVVIDKYIYWLVCDEISINQSCNLIMSFDLANDEFREISLPRSLALELTTDLSIFKIWESLAVVDCVGYGCPESYDVWMMEYGVSESFIKLFRINVTDPSAIENHVHEFRKAGEPILELQLDDESYSEPVVLALYEPCFGDIKDIESYESVISFQVKSYTESLLLLNEPEFSCYGMHEVEDDDD